MTYGAAQRSPVIRTVNAMVGLPGFLLVLALREVMRRTSR